MASAKSNPMQGFGRGIFGLKSFDPLRKPKGRGLGRGNVDQNLSGQESRPGQFNQSPAARSDHPRPAVSDVSQQKESLQPTDVKSGVAGNKAKGNNAPKKGTSLKAGYSYSANPNSPLGYELSFSQNENLKFIEVHETNPEWWVCETANGTLGYVPAKYMVSCELTSLPWLQGQEEEVVEEQPSGNNVFGRPEKATFKPYRPSFDHTDLGVKPAQTAASQWRCDVCDKDFNGPKPYQAHMVSKAHKEELAYRQGE